MARAGKAVSMSAKYDEFFWRSRLTLASHAVVMDVVVVVVAMGEARDPHVGSKMSSIQN